MEIDLSTGKMAAGAPVPIGTGQNDAATRAAASILV